MKMEVKIKKESNKIVCEISVLEYRHRNCKKRIYLSERIVKEKLINDYKLNVGECLKTGQIDNFRGSCSDIWIFEDADQIKPKLRPKTRTTRKTSKNTPRKAKKTEKQLDKSPEDVIIVKEKKESPILPETKSVTEE